MSELTIHKYVVRNNEHEKADRNIIIIMKVLLWSCKNVAYLTFDTFSWTKIFLIILFFSCISIKEREIISKLTCLVTCAALLSLSSHLLVITFPTFVFAGVGMTAPDPSQTYVTEDGVVIPMGKGVNLPGRSSLLYNEYPLSHLLVVAGLILMVMIALAHLSISSWDITLKLVPYIYQHGLISKDTLFVDLILYEN